MVLDHVRGKENLSGSGKHKHGVGYSSANWGAQGNSTGSWTPNVGAGQLLDTT